MVRFADTIGIGASTPPVPVRVRAAYNPALPLGGRVDCSPLRNLPLKSGPAVFPTSPVEGPHPAVAAVAPQGPQPPLAAHPGYQLSATAETLDRPVGQRLGFNRIHLAGIRPRNDDVLEQMPE